MLLRTKNMCCLSREPWEKNPECQRRESCHKWQFKSLKSGYQLLYMQLSKSLKSEYQLWNSLAYLWLLAVGHLLPSSFYLQSVFLHVSSHNRARLTLFIPTVDWEKKKTFLTFSVLINFKNILSNLDVPPDHLLLDRSPNIGPLISRW
jgi:hypothetical protein